MNVEYIIVQAGGKGTRLEHLTVNKPKALVPVYNLPMIFHLFRKYPDKKFIIIGDYQKDVLRKYLRAFANVKYILVDAMGAKGTCAGIKAALNIIPPNVPFMVMWSDLILPEGFQMPSKEGNYIGISKDFKCRWSYKDGVLEEEPSYEHGVAGLFVFRNKEVIHDVKEEGEFVRWLKDKNKYYEELSLSGTKEFGVLEEYNVLAVERCRPFNKMIMKDDVIVKEGIDKQGKELAVKEKRWYQFVKEKGYKHIPQIYDFEPLTMERIQGKNIFEYNLDFEEKKKVLTNIVNSLKELHSLGDAEKDCFSIKENYTSKTLDRLNKIRDLVPFADQKTIIINGKPCKNVFYYQKKLEDKIEQIEVKQFNIIHGDCTFSNLMLKGETEPVLIDPRGYFGFTEFFGDVNYDWAKVYYSIVGNYDQFNIKNFRLTILEDKVKLTIDSNGWEEMESLFFELVGEGIKPEDIKLIHAIIWLSLTTYAWQDYDSICAAFYNGLLYLEELW